MRRKLILLFAICLATEQQAAAETCKLQVARKAGEWKFVKAYDADTGEVVLQQVITGGHHKEATVSGKRIRVDWKLPGDAKYRAGAVTLCKRGNTIKV